MNPINEIELEIAAERAAQFAHMGWTLNFLMMAVAAILLTVIVAKMFYKPRAEREYHDAELQAEASQYLSAAEWNQFCRANGLANYCEREA